MNQKAIAALEAHPALGWLASVVSLLTGAFAWFIEHADDFAKVFGFGAAVFGCIAGYYTMRVQRRVWLKGEKEKND